jgi:hypothetical protein
VRLGKKLGVVEDRRTIMAEQVLLPDEVKVPVRHRIATGLTHVPMYVNDRLGDCTQAKKGHAIMTMERASSQSEIQVTDDDVVRAYMRVGGYVPGHPETDNGAYELDSLNDWRQNGIGVQRDGTPHKIDAFVRVDHTNHDEVLLAHYVFGGLMVCAGLPVSAERQIQRGEPWDVVSGSAGRFGSWGGHSMYSHVYDRDQQPTPIARNRFPGLDGIAIWTWAQEQWMTWPWWDAYVDEVYAVKTPDYMRRSGTTPQGLDSAKLDRLLAAL